MVSLEDLHCDLLEPLDVPDHVHAALNQQRHEILQALEHSQSNLLATLHTAFAGTSVGFSSLTPRSQEEEVLVERQPNPPVVAMCPTDRACTKCPGLGAAEPPVASPKVNTAKGGRDQSSHSSPRKDGNCLVKSAEDDREVSAHASTAMDRDCTVKTTFVSDDLQAEVSSAAWTQTSTEAMDKGDSCSPRKATRIRQLPKAVDDTSFSTRLRWWVHSPAFELGFAVLICINTIVMACQLQYSGIDIGNALGFPTYDEPARAVWPGALRAFYWLELAFGSVFTIEVCTKLIAERLEFIRSLWNYYDVLIISFWLVQLISDLNFAISPMLMRLARVARLMRLLRFVRAFQVFDVLNLLVHSLKACMSAFFWSMVLLLLVMCICALGISWALEPIFEDPSRSLEMKHDLFRYFGTFTRGILSMYEITLGNWVPITRFLTDEVSEMYSLLVLLYRTFVGFAVLKVIGGIFLLETFRVAASNDEIMIMQRERAVRKHSQRMMTLLREADESDDGFLSLQEFRDILDDGRVQKWLAAQEIEVKDADLVFQMVDDEGDQRLSPEELVRGFARLKGPAKSMDLVAVIHATLRVEQRIVDLMESVMKLRLDPAQRRSSQMPSKSEIFGPLILGTSVSPTFVNAHRDNRASDFIKKRQATSA
eukprot:TRINITY_DN6648_c0_g2_i1.p1 TRINITY_DN6648_c0_g2~~TRINITY_DN6648_c0_g2_i1.p1  ORF type:complete len:652 (-),score=77.51 TRINITY_DN6648_c0_g2_i1:72-2027(-)